MRRVSIFGATGSIGQNTIDLISRAPEEYRVVALTGGRNVTRLAEDARRLGAELAVVSDEALLPDLRAALAGSGVEAAAGRTALLEAADRPADWVMSAIVGAAGLEPGLRALGQGATLALANKESMVCAGRLMLAAAQGPWRADPAGRQRTFGGLSGAGGRGYRGGRAGDHHRLGRRLPRLAHRERCEHATPDRGRDPSQLGDGPADHDQFRLDVQQGAGTD